VERWLGGKLKERKVMREGEIKGDGKGRRRSLVEKSQKKKNKVKMKKVEERER
jgi:hypothetical protein